MTTVADFTLPLLSGEAQSLSAHAGKLVLIVNTASKCGLTPQYEGLEALYRQFGPQDFVVLGFPCNQFNGQEPGSAEDIAQFCSLNYDVTFPIFAKVDVNGDNESPLYRWLKARHPGDVEWNFTKFLVGRNGEVLARFEPSVAPADIAPVIAARLLEGSHSARTVRLG